MIVDKSVDKSAENLTVSRMPSPVSYYVLRHVASRPKYNNEECNECITRNHAPHSPPPPPSSVYYALRNTEIVKLDFQVQACLFRVH